MEKSKYEYSTIPTPEGLTELIDPLRAEALKRSLERGLLVDTAVCLVSPPQQPTDPARVSFGVLMDVNIKVGLQGEVWPYGSVLKNVASAGEHCYETYHIDLIFPGGAYMEAWAFAHKLVADLQEEQAVEQCEKAGLPEAP